MLLGTLGASLLGNPLTGKGINKAGEGVLKLVMVVVRKITWIFNTAPPFN